VAYSARVLLDSVSPIGVRLTTLEVTFPRFVLAEFNTHRVFCLDGDTRLYFDLPGGRRRKGTQRFTMTLREIFEKWHFGAAPRPSREYAARELAAAAGYAHSTGIDLLTRRTGVPRVLTPPGAYRIRGADFSAWRETVGTNRQPVRDRIAAMHLRSCNEDTGEIYHTHLRDVTCSGHKPAFRVTLTDGRQIVSTRDHLFLTREGWQRLEDAVGLSLSPGEIATWTRHAEFAVNGTEAYRDPEWLAALRDAGYSAARIAARAAISTDRANGFKCVLCGSGRRLHAHHVDPVGSLRLRKPYVPKSRRTMVRQFVGLRSIEYVGLRDTYDVEVEGPHHNFVADGFVVHNSRNSASSRAVPTAKLIERVEREPAAPLEWGRNKAGMSASDVLTEEEALAAQAIWLRARDDAVARARELLELNVHKQELNRILEPFLWHTVIVTATEWQNFFDLRCAPNAQPEIRAAAVRMREAIAQSSPRGVANGEWHTPLLQHDELTLDSDTRRRVSAARCARVSYLTHEGKREIGKDLELYERLKTDRHLSPFEHVATPAADGAFHANFRGWVQMRAEVE
jgi:thymidylate synthase ThyX